MKERTYCDVDELDVVVVVRVDRGQRHRIASRSFQGRDVQQAGNFSAWNDVGAFLDDLELDRDVLQRIVDAARASTETFCVEIDLEEDIGWTTVLRVNDPWLTAREPYDVAEGRLDNGVLADFVTDLPAPLTSLVTVIGRGQMLGDTLHITLYNVRPGMATPRFPRPHRFRGRMVGARVAEELNLVFWKFDDPGEDPPSDDDWNDEDDRE